MVPATETHFGAAFADPPVIPLLLLHFDAANGSTDFYDSSGNFITTVLDSSGVVIDNSQSVFGGTSLRVPGTISHLGIAGDNSALSFGTGAFTVDFWFQHLNTGVQHQLVDSRGQDAGAGTPDNWAIYIDGTDHISFAVNSVGNIITGPVIQISTWFHCALTRQGMDTRLFLNGAQVGITYADNNNYVIGTSGPDFGSGAGGTAPLDGWLDEVRFVKGKAIWTGNFTPPSAPYKPPG